MNEELKLDDSERTVCECWTRVMGYLRPTSQFNKGKKSEFEERTPFVEGNLGCACEKVSFQKVA